MSVSWSKLVLSGAVLLSEPHSPVIHVTCLENVMESPRTTVFTFNHSHAHTSVHHVLCICSCRRDFCSKGCSVHSLPPHCLWHRRSHCPWAFLHYVHGLPGETSLSATSQFLIFITIYDNFIQLCAPSTLSSQQLLEITNPVLDCATFLPSWLHRLRRTQSPLSATRG